MGDSPRCAGSLMFINGGRTRSTVCRVCGHKVPMLSRASATVEHTTDGKRIRP